MINNKRKIIIIGAILIIVITLIKNVFLKQDNYNEISFSGDNIVVENIQKEEISNNIESPKIKVHITGEVNSPGLVELDSGSRIADAIDLAGGLTGNADTSKTNLAYILSDGEKIYIPSFDDEENSESLQDLDSKSKININVAGLEELQKIPGVGESTAKSIIEYRTKTGKFTVIEDIKNVSGIGDSKFEKMKEYICVK